MAAEEVDWDLNAVVRSFTTAADRTSSSAAVKSDDQLPYLTSMDVFRNRSQSQSSCPSVLPELLHPRSNGLDELQQLLRPYFISSDNNSSHGTNSSSDGQMYNHQGCSLNMPPQIMIRPPPPSTVVFPGGVFRGGIQPQPPVQSQTPRSRKRKNQVKKSVCHVTGENLSSDMWAWRKYGQKPIKGSPYPRNYYRCSSSKGCTARKQVEKSTTDQNLFIITYTGEHSHPRPTHRNSLAGSTRNKLTNTLLKSTAAGNEEFNPPLPTVSGRSPTTPLTAPVTSEEPVLSMDDMDYIDGMEKDDDLLIPNAMSEVFFPAVCGFAI